MRVLIDLGHPAHVHLFRNLYHELVDDGHFVVVCTKDIPIVKSLLTLYSIPFVVLGKKSDNLIGKVWNQIYFGYKVLRIVNKHKIDVAIGTSINIAHVSKISRAKSFVFDDDDDAKQPLMVLFGHPFADYLISPDVLNFERTKPNEITYPGYHELAYLHPCRFSPEPNVLADLGLREGETFFILRFAAFKAHHDIGISGLSLDQKRRLVNFLSEFGRVIITTERDIDEEFLPYQLKVSPDKMHSLMAYAKILIGDSQTMCSEAAVLGVPSLRCNSFAGRVSYLEEQEKKFGLVYSFLPAEFEKLFELVQQWVSDPLLAEKWKQKRQAMLNQKIDVTSFFKDMLYRFDETGEIDKTQFDFENYKRILQ